MPKLSIFAVFFGLVLSACAVVAGELEEVQLAPMDLIEATLSVTAPDGSVTQYSPETLETFPTYALETQTPWRDAPARFEGVLLSDILERHALDRVAAIWVIAENDFEVRFERDLLDSVPILVATRVDGQPHSRRARGPIQFVIDHEVATRNPKVFEHHFVWMAARIEPAS